MRTIVNISMVLVILLSTAVFAAKPKKQKQSAAESKNAVEQASMPVEESNKPALEPNVPVAEPNSVPVLIKAEEKEVNKSGAVVATVNGTAITEAQIEEALVPRMQQLASRVPPNMIPQYRQQLRKRVIDQLVVESLITLEEKKNNIDVNQSELDQQINKQIAQQNLTIDEFKALLKAYGTTFGDFQQNIRKRLMFEKLMEIQFVGKLKEPADEQLKAYYNENVQQFQKPEAINVKHILISPAKDSNKPAEAQEAAKAKAEDILKKVKAGGNFEEIAKKNSDCPSAPNGGDLGIQVKGNLVPEFEKAAYALKPGQVSDVVETSFGFHIIKLVEHIDANTTSFEQAKDEIKRSLADEQKEKIVMDYIQKIRTGADVKYTDEADKLDLETTGAKIAPPSRKPTENVQPSDENKPAPKDTGELKKD